MEKSFRPAEVEPRWRKRWEELGVGRADPSSGRPPFVIALPPPNITGVLHLGHATGFSVQDILARYHRMLGDEVEWCPGTDHAAIATNAVIERQLLAEGQSREAIGRERFQERVDAWYARTGSRILEQMRQLGFTCDWSRTRFTLDEPYVQAIRMVFKTLFDEGLIYRGPRIVNWCPHDRSAISDEEVDWQEHTDTLTHLRYPVQGGGFVTVATVRPETMLGDTAVAVSPGDARYAGLAGKTVVLPLVSRAIPVIEDAAVRPEFGTGALKVTPGHDPTDYDIGRRHSLPTVTVIAADGTMDVPTLPQFHGMPAVEARAAVTQALRELGVVQKEEPYVHDVGHCDRCGTVLEPQISEQWWVSMGELAAPAIDVVERDEVRFHPHRYTDTYLSWMRNLRDWCISRQIWLGHAIPVSTCANRHIFAWINQPAECPECGNQDLTHDPDVLDTWFSSALWPYAIFGWPADTPELRRFYPTDVLVTAREIIFLWVARMIMTGLRFAGARPFRDVIINSTILAADGSRMSKSKGNAIDPIDMVDRYGADAVRAWAGAVGTAGQDLRFDEHRLSAYQRFANKLHSVTRLLVQRLGSEGEHIAELPQVEEHHLAPEDRWILALVAETIAACDAAMSAYRFHDAIERLYDLTWHSYCDSYIELAKSRLGDDASPGSRAAAAHTSVTVLDVLLRLLHPFMPFVTEECAQRLPAPARSLQEREWPRTQPGWDDHPDTRRAVDELLEFVQRLRAARQEAGVPSSSRERHPLLLRQRPEVLDQADVHRMVETLAPVSVADEASGPAVVVVSGGYEAALHTGGEVNREQLERQGADLDRYIAGLQQQLTNAGFTERAPATVVDGARRRLEDAQQQRDTIRKLLE